VSRSSEHELTDCQHKDVLDAEVAEARHRGAGDQGEGRRCKVCEVSRHNRAIWPALHAAKERIRRLG